MYSFFDSIICISLKENVNRQNHARSVAKALSIPMKFHLVDRHPVSGAIGCFESHIQVIRMMYESGVKVGLILEDDLVPSPGYSHELLQNAIDFMRVNDTWEMFQLGYSPWKHELDFFAFYRFMNATPVSKSVVQYTGMQTHAYCISRKGMKTILSTIDRNALNTIQVDQWLCKTITQGYCVTPILFDQKWCFQSDNILTSAAGFVLSSQKVRCLTEEYKLFYYLSLLPHLRLPFRIFTVFTAIIVAGLLLYKINDKNVQRYTKRFVKL